MEDREDKITDRDVFNKLISIESTLAVIQNTLRYLPCESHCKRLDKIEEGIGEIKIEAEKNKYATLLGFLGFLGFIVNLLKDWIEK